MRLMEIWMNFQVVCKRCCNYFPMPMPMSITTQRADIVNRNGVFYLLHCIAKVFGRSGAELCNWYLSWYFLLVRKDRVVAERKVKGTRTAGVTQVG